VRGPMLAVLAVDTIPLGWRTPTLWRF